MKSKKIKKKKKTQLNIQFLMAFVAFIILIVSMVYFINNQTPKVESLLKEKLFYVKEQSIKQKIFGYYGLPPNWNSSLENVKVLGFSISPYILDYSKIYFNKELVKNSESRKKFVDLFKEKVNDKEIQTYWLAYYKIKSLTPYNFFQPYGYLKIYRELWGLNITYNISNFSNSNIYLELLTTDPILDAKSSEKTFLEAKEIGEGMNLIKFYTNETKKGYLVIYYKNKTLDYGVKYLPPRMIIIKALECTPTEICEQSGFIEGKKKIPLIDYFGMLWYKNVVDKYQAVENIEINLLKTFFSNYIVETHYFVWTDEINP
jgi:hypothetical protein